MLNKLSGFINNIIAFLSPRNYALSSPSPRVDLEDLHRAINVDTSPSGHDRNGAILKKLTPRKEKVKKQQVVNSRLYRFDIEQNSVEWHKLRWGKITASNAACLLAKSTKLNGDPLKGSGGEIGEQFESLGKGAVSYAKKKAIERHANYFDENNFTSYDMQRGSDLEPFAFKKYTTLTGNQVIPCGFVEAGKYGFSPDGIDTDRRTGLELKCPNKETHLDYLMDPDSLVDKYHAQVQFAMFVTGFDKWDIMSYHPNFKDHNTAIIKTVYRNEVAYKEFQYQIVVMEELIAHFIIILD